MREMKPCPFCGDNAALYYSSGRYGCFCYVECDLCGAKSKAVSMGTRNPDDDWAESLPAFKAIDAWNRRVGEKDG